MVSEVVFFQEFIKRSTFHNFHKHFCCGTNFQYIFLLFEVIIVNTGALREDNPFWVVGVSVIYHRICYALS